MEVQRIFFRGRNSPPSWVARAFSQPITTNRWPCYEKSSGIKGENVSFDTIRSPLHSMFQLFGL